MARSAWAAPSEGLSATQRGVSDIFIKTYRNRQDLSLNVSLSFGCTSLPLSWLPVRSNNPYSSGYP